MPIETSRVRPGPTCVCQVPAARLRRAVQGKRLFVFDLDDTLLDLEREETAAVTILSGEMEQRFGVNATEFRAFYRREVKTDRRTQASATYSWGEPRYVERFDRVVRHFRDGGLQLDAEPLELHERLLRLRRSAVRPTPFAIDLLAALRRKGIPVACFTHGTTRVQSDRIRAARLAPYLRHVVTSEQSGCSKAELGRWWSALPGSPRIPVDAAVLVTDRVHPDISGANAIGLPSVLCQPTRPGHEGDLAALLSAVLSERADEDPRWHAPGFGRERIPGARMAFALAERSFVWWRPARSV